MTAKKMFRAGVVAAKRAITAEMVENWEAWGQADTDERCSYVESVKVPFPSELETLGKFPWHATLHSGFGWPKDDLYDCGCRSCTEVRVHAIDYRHLVYGPWTS